MNKKYIAIFATSLILFISLWNYAGNLLGSGNSLDSFSLFKFVVTLITVIFIVVPILGYGTLRIAQDSNNISKQNKSKSTLHDLFLLGKALVGILGISIGFLIIYLDLTIYNIENKFYIVLHILLIYIIISTGVKILLSSVKSYRNQKV